MSEPWQVVALLTCHNRREKTLTCLKHYFRQEVPASLQLSAILMDDGSTDGTTEAVAQRFPSVQILLGDGTLYWNRGMHRAFAQALQQSYDFYLWLNDDTHLYPTAVANLYQTFQACSSQESVIVVGSTQDPTTQVRTYGGLVNYISWSPLHVRPVVPADHPQPCTTMNGNCILIPDTVARRIGNLDPRFTHGMGDNDYGYRATQQGIALMVTPGYVGTCPRNDPDQTADDMRLSWIARIRRKMTLKAMPPDEWLYFVRKHGGWLWPYYFVSPYLAIAKRSLLGQ